MVSVNLTEARSTSSVELTKPGQVDRELVYDPSAVSLFFPDGIPVEDDNDVEVGEGPYFFWGGLFF